MAAGQTICGTGATFKQGASQTVVDNTAEWSISITAATVDYATNSTSGWKRRCAGTKDWSGTVRLYIHSGAAAALSVGTAYDVEFHVDGGGANYYAGSAMVNDINNVTANIETGEPIGFEYALGANGVLAQNGVVPL